MRHAEDLRKTTSATLAESLIMTHNKTSSLESSQDEGAVEMTDASAVRESRRPHRFPGLSSTTPGIAHRARSPPASADLTDMEPCARWERCSRFRSHKTARPVIATPAVLNPQTRPAKERTRWTHLWYLGHRPMATPCNRPARSTSSGHPPSWGCGPIEVCSVSWSARPRRQRRIQER